MDELEKAWFENRFEILFLRKKGNEFQDFFCDLMEARYPLGDFIRTRPWGQQGDRKNDGYLKSTRTLFQVYAPDELTETAAKAKIIEDFEGALPYWSAHFDRWVFVHNADKGFGPGVTKLLLEISERDEKKMAAHWSFNELRAEFLSLDREKKIRLVGHPPSQRSLTNLALPHLQSLLEQIARVDPPKSPDLRPVSPTKIQYNALGDSSRILIEAGSQKSPLVDKYFEGQLDPQVRDQVAEALKSEYQKIRESEPDPNRVLGLLLEAISGARGFDSPDVTVAALAIVAHFFESCDIFERPEGE